MQQWDKNLEHVLGFSKSVTDYEQVRRIACRSCVPLASLQLPRLPLAARRCPVACDLCPIS